MRPINKIFILLALAFAAFLAYVIQSANASVDFYFVKWVSALPYGDKIGHFCLMGLMTLILNLALKNKRIPLFNHRILLGSLLIFILITIEECSQHFNPNRTFDWMDLSANYLGILAFSFLAIFLDQRFFKFNEKR